MPGAVAGHLFLTGAGFPFDQHGGGGRAHIGDQFEDGVHTRALAEHVVEGVLRLQPLPQVSHLVLQGALTQGALDQYPQIVNVDGFGEKIVGAQPDGLHGIVDAAKRRHDDHGHRQAPFLDGADQIKAIEAGHAQISQNKTVVLFG